MLGHASATMTLDTYGHLFENRLDEVADALDRARILAQERSATQGAGAEVALPGVAQTLPKEGVSDLTAHRVARKAAGQRRNSTASASGTRWSSSERQRASSRPRSFSAPSALGSPGLDTPVATSFLGRAATRPGGRHPRFCCCQAARSRMWAQAVCSL